MSTHASPQEQFPQPPARHELARVIDIATRKPFETPLVLNQTPYDWAAVNKVEITSRVVEPGETPQFPQRESIVRQGAQVVKNALGLNVVPREQGAPTNPAKGVADRVRSTERLRRSWH